MSNDQSADEDSQIEVWQCASCGHTSTAPVGELAGERYEQTINPTGRREERTIETVRCPECGDEDAWQSESVQDLSEALSQL